MTSKLPTSVIPVAVFVKRFSDEARCAHRSVGPWYPRWSTVVGCAKYHSTIPPFYQPYGAANATFHIFLDNFFFIGIALLFTVSLVEYYIYNILICNILVWKKNRRVRNFPRSVSFLSRAACSPKTRPPSRRPRRDIPKPFAKRLFDNPVLPTPRETRCFTAKGRP